MISERLPDEDFNKAIADLVITVFGAVYDAVKNPDKTIPLHVFSKESKELIEAILAEIDKDVEQDLDNIEVSLEQLH